MYWMPTRMLCRRPASVRVPRGGSSSIGFGDRRVCEPADSWFGPGMPSSKIAFAIGTSAGMRDPGAVVAGAHLAQLVGAHLVERRVVGGRVVLDRDLRGHAAHGVGAAAMAGLRSAAARRRSGTVLPW